MQRVLGHKLQKYKDDVPNVNWAKTPILMYINCNELAHEEKNSHKLRNEVILFDTKLESDADVNKFNGVCKSNIQ